MGCCVQAVQHTPIANFALRNSLATESTSMGTVTSDLLTFYTVPSDVLTYLLTYLLTALLMAIDFSSYYCACFLKVQSSTLPISLSQSNPRT